MNIRLSYGIAVVAALFGASTAQAQLSGLKPIGVSLRAGAFFPIDSSARDLGTTWFAFGAEYKLLDLNSASMPKSAIGVSFDYFGRNGLSNTPILLNWSAHNGSIFYGAGAGVGAARLPDEDKLLFSYQVGIGYEFATSQTTPFFVEARFWGCQRNELNGVGVYAGVRL